MTLYEQCRDAATPIVKAYQSDITEHDKKALTGYSGEIIYAARDTGTNLILLANPAPDHRATRQAVEVFTFQPNYYFWISENGILKRVAKCQAWAKWHAYCKAHGFQTVNRDAP